MVTLLLVSMDITTFIVNCITGIKLIPWVIISQLMTVKYSKQYTVLSILKTAEKTKPNTLAAFLKFPKVKIYLLVHLLQRITTSNIVRPISVRLWFIVNVNTDHTMQVQRSVVWKLFVQLFCSFSCLITGYNITAVWMNVRFQCFNHAVRMAIAMKQKICKRRGPFQCKSQLHYLSLLVALKLDKLADLA